MSKLIDKMNRAGHAAPAPMGFRTAKAEAAAARLLLVANVAPAVTAANLAACAAGADAAIISPPKGGAAPKLPNDMPWGARAEGTVKGADFIIMDAAGPVAAAPKDDDETGAVLEIDAAWTDGQLRAAGDLPLDAVLAEGILKSGGKLTWQHLIAVQRLAAFTGQHLLLAAPPTLAEAEIKALWEAGADALVVDAAKADALKGLKETIGRIKFPAERKGNKTEALLPRLGLNTGEAAAEPDEDDDDWDDE